MISLQSKIKKILNFLRKKKIKRYNQTGLYVRAVKDRLQFLLSKVEHIPGDQALALATKILQSRFENNCQHTSKMIMQQEF